MARLGLQRPIEQLGHSKRCRDRIDSASQHLVGPAQHRVLFMNRRWNTAQFCRQQRGKGRIAAKPQYEIWANLGQKLVGRSDAPAQLYRGKRGLQCIAACRRRHLIDIAGGKSCAIPVAARISHEIDRNPAPGQRFG